MTPPPDPLSDLRGGPNLVRLHGHRGARGAFPENTLEGFEYAFSIGLKIVELDVLTTKDGVAVVTHNPALNAASTRDPNGAWLSVDGPRIDAVTYRDLAGFDVGSLRSGTDYGAKFTDQAVLRPAHIPTLSAVVDLVNSLGQSDIWLNLEVKSDPTDTEATDDVPALVSAILAPILAGDLEKRTLIQSFDWRILREAQKQIPCIATSCLSYLPKADAPMVANIYDGSSWMDGALSTESLPRMVKTRGASVWSPHFSDLTELDLRAAQNEGLIVNVWTVNEISDLDRFISMGVDGIITDFPARAQQRILAAGKDWMPKET